MLFTIRCTALQQVIDRIRKLNTAAAVGTGDKKSRQSFVIVLTVAAAAAAAAVEVSRMRHNFVSIIIAIFK
jgi:hypothetical protein